MRCEGKLPRLDGARFCALWLLEVCRLAVCRLAVCRLAVCRLAVCSVDRESDSGDHGGYAANKEGFM